MRTINLLLQVLLITLVGCITPEEMKPTAPLAESPGEILARIDKSLAAKDSLRTWELLDSLDDKTLPARALEKRLYLTACAHYQDGKFWPCFKSLEKLAAQFPVTEFAAQAAWMEFQIGKYLLHSRSGIFNLLSNRADGLAVLKHLSIYWSDQVEPGRPGNLLADDALAMVAADEWDNKEWQSTIDRYSQLVTTYPGSEWSTLAFYRIAKSWFNLIEGPAYDRNIMEKTERELVQFVKSGKGSPAQKKDIQDSIGQVRKILAERCLREGTYYITLNCPKGAVLHLEEALTLYPGTPAAKEAERLLPKWKDLAAKELARTKEKAPE